MKGGDRIRDLEAPKCQELLGGAGKEHDAAAEEAELQLHACGLIEGSDSSSIPIWRRIALFLPVGVARPTAASSLPSLGGKEG
ncbi:MAG TPA: hypothetical protein DEA63_01965 [Firmicutes bacterium]|nr:hypothetical protein [Bacillota bacterium]